ncbi:P-loop containing nucleoside triphosphate hydrolase protein, partial [Blyttiomyces helicus]
QEKLIAKYKSKLGDAEIFGIKKQIVTGGGWGSVQFWIYGTYALAFYYGATLIIEAEIDAGDILTTFFSVLIGAFALAGTSTEMTAFSFATGAATTLFGTIDRVPEIDSASLEGFQPATVTGRVVVQGVKFRYPSRQEVVVLHGMDLEIEAGTTCALVGSSGSGKSTIISLLERFYNPEAGTISLDGIDISSLNVNWLRRQIGYVTQEPVLFKGTLWENVAHGLIGTPDATLPKPQLLEKVIEACKFANAHNFISELPLGYETRIGERGLLLSGGQKQRVAIARAIVKNPKILLLDEATSALDTESEKIVQEALDRASQGRTTIVIAHRLSTIRNANKIVVMDQGRILETGTHSSLLEIEGGFYRKLVEAQQISAKTQPAEPESESEETGDEAVDERPEGIAPGAKSPTGTTGRRSRSLRPSVDSLNKKGVPAAESPPPIPGIHRVVARILKHNMPEMMYISIAVVSASINGITQPIFSVLFGHILKVFFETDPVQLRSDANFWASMFLVIGVVNLVASFLKYAMFGLSGEKLTTRLRDRSFSSMLRQDIAWFDIEKNSTGALVSNLSRDASNVQTMSGQAIGNLIELFSAIFGAAVVALVTGWKLGLVVLSTLPLLVFANKMRMDLMRKGNTATKAYYERSAQVACEAVASMRTIAALTREDDVVLAYHKDLEEPLRIGHRNAFVNTILFAVSSSLNFLTNALSFWYGGKLISNLEYDIQSFFTVFMSVVFASQAAGRVFSLMPDVGKAKESALEILELLARVPIIDSWGKGGTVLNRADAKGEVVFRNVRFSYPNRPSIKVLRGLDIKILPGQFVALVGPSGCGKSTTVGLIERFYDITGGSLTIDGIDISKMNVESLRSIISLVGQEPNLYSMTIRDNIAFGMRDRPSDAEIEQACRDANIHEFITSLPDGYDTDLKGSASSKLSGGQKQRIAIARALIRKPKILLLDEATSALDATSEKIVQAALDVASKGRTTIAIAHRLSTIKAADVIYVLKDGVVAESGTHGELIARQGLYYQLVIQQDLSASH